MNRPSTVVIVPFMIVHTIPNKGRMPSTTDTASNMGRTLPPYPEISGGSSRSRTVLLFRVVLRRARTPVAPPSFLGRFVRLAPEAVAGAVDEYILKRRLADAHRLNFSGECFHQFGDEAMTVLHLDAYLVRA